MLADYRKLDDSNEPLEVIGGVPDSICRFASAVVRARVLASPIEIRRIPLGLSATTLGLEAGFDGLANLPEYKEWTDWIRSWVSRFGAYSEAHVVNLRISHSRHPTCPRFHVDEVRMRLIATLLGPGTEWLRSHDVERAADGEICQTPNPEVVRQIASGRFLDFTKSAT